ncbi:MAG TPA: single-stranded DNA-binding protein [Ktedonobacteraceae bacterium]|nr:single-stranded DNA-binding protein [Ktedonobacteraceae bacterium]
MLNKIMLIGHLGKDPDFNVTPDGTPVARFTLAVSRNIKTSSGERREETEWFNVTAWRQLAEICEKYLHKGSKVYIEGRLTTRKYTDRDGNQRTSVDVTASEMEMLDSKAASGASGNYAPGGSSSSYTPSSASQSDDYDPFLDPDELP